MPMRALVRVVIACAVCAIAFPSVGLAQLDWLPCSLRSPGGGGIGLPSSGGGAYGGLNLQRDETATFTLEEAAVTAAQPAGGGLRLGAATDVWQLSFSAAAADLDAFGGTDVPEISVRSFAMAVDAAFGGKFGVTVTIPWFDVHSDAPGDDDASGFGDVGVDFGVLLTEFTVADTHDSWLELMVGATLPTGDDGEGLGYGDATAHVGLGWWTGKDQGSDFPWLAPKWLVHVAALYGHSFVSSDLATFALEAGVAFGGDAVTGSVAVGTEWEIGGYVDLGPGMTRDAERRTDLSLGVAFQLGKEKHHELAIHAVVALDDDGLRDELVPMLVYRTRGRIN